MNSIYQDKKDVEKHKSKLSKVIDADPVYSALVDKLKISYENLLAENIMKIKETSNQELITVKNDLDKERKRTNKLEKENVDLTKEYEKQREIISSQQELIVKLKKKMNLSNSELKHNHKEEVILLNQENEKLKSENEKLIIELNQVKVREESLINLLKGNMYITEFKDITSNCMNLQNQITIANPRISQNKVEVPRLDFSKLTQKAKASIKIVQCDQDCSHTSSSVLSEVNI